jgi:hypothetical protein
MSSTSRQHGDRPQSEIAQTPFFYTAGSKWISSGKYAGGGSWTDVTEGPSCRDILLSSRTGLPFKKGDTRNMPSSNADGFSSTGREGRRRRRRHRLLHAHQSPLRAIATTTNPMMKATRQRGGIQRPERSTSTSGPNAP